jgi:hypothetical protein
VMARRGAYITWVEDTELHLAEPTHDYELQGLDLR